MLMVEIACCSKHFASPFEINEFFE